MEKESNLRASLRVREVDGYYAKRIPAIGIPISAGAKVVYTRSDM